jgi:NAD(P)-dependent dehydrogenase (short-subunit alcohol dehydrogenase family)
MHDVIVTGGSRGLEPGIARRLAAARYRVIAVARKENSAFSPLCLPPKSLVYHQLQDD